MYTEKITHPTQFNILSVDSLFASTFTVINSASNVVEVSTLSAAEALIDIAKIKIIDNPFFVNMYTVITANSANWGSVYTTVNVNSAEWESVYTSTIATSSNWNSVFSTVRTNSANYILQNGNSPSTTLLIGTNNTQPLHFETNGTARAAILSDGKVGIGTTTPAVKFEVTDNSSTDAVRITQTGAGNALAVYDEASDTTPFVVNSIGNVGVGVSAPLSTLHVRDTILTTPIGYLSNQNQAYLIAGTTSHTGSAANWGTYGFQHRFKTDSGGTPRLTIDTSTSPGLTGEILTILTTGNVGINTTNPTYTLDIGNIFIDGLGGIRVRNLNTGSSAHTILQIGNNTNGAAAAIRLNSSAVTTTMGGADALSLINGLNAPLVLATNNVERVRILGSGNVGINTTNPGAQLTVSGNISASGNLFSTGAISTSGTITAFGGTFNSTSGTEGGQITLMDPTGAGAWEVDNLSQNFRIFRDKGVNNISDALRITSAGNIGIGASTPVANTNYRTLTIYELSGGIITLGRNSTNRSEWATTPTETYIETKDSTPLWLGTNDTQRLTILSGGNVGINITTPNERLTVSGNISAIGSVFSNSLDANIATIGTINARGLNPSQLVLNAGESNTYAINQGDEAVYINAESGLQVTSSPDNWLSGWNFRNGAIICNPQGNSAFGLSGAYINATPRATVDVFGNIRFGERNKATGINSSGILSNTWTAAENYKFFTLGSSYFNQITSRWITNEDALWGSNNVVNIAGDVDGIKFFLTPATGANIARSETTNDFNTHERLRVTTSGDVGIGLTNPSSKLDVNGNIEVNSSLIFNPTTNTSICATQVGSIDTLTIRCDDNIDLATITDGVILRATSTAGSPGNYRVGIGSTSPVATLDVNAGQKTTGTALNVTVSANAVYNFATFSNTNPTTSGAALIFGSSWNNGDYISSAVRGDTVIRTNNHALGIAGLSGVKIGAGTNWTERVRITSEGISITESGQTPRSALAPLTFSNTFNNVSKIDLYNNNGDRYGFGMASLDGVNPAILQIYTGVNGGDTGGISFGVEDTTGLLVERVRFRKSGEVHIGNAGLQSTNARLAITPTAAECKLTLWDNGNLSAHYGFGISNGQINYEAVSTGSHVFYTGNKNGFNLAGDSPGGPPTPSPNTINGTERMRIRGSDGNVSIGGVTPNERLTVSGNISATGAIFGARAVFNGSGTSGSSSGFLFNSFPILEKALITTTANSLANLDALTTNVWLCTANSTSTWNHNVRGNGSTTLNSLLTVGDSLNLTIISKQNSTANRFTNLTIDSVAATVLWEGGTAPTAGLSTAGYDAYSFTIIKIAENSYTVFGSLTRLG